MNTETRNRARLSAVFASLLLVLASGARADVVTDWNTIMGDVVADLPNPAAAARTAVITQVAVFEAVNSIVGDYEPYRYRIKVAPGCIAGCGSHCRGTRRARKAASGEDRANRCPA